MARSTTSGRRTGKRGQAGTRIAVLIAAALAGVGVALRGEDNRQQLRDTIGAVPASLRSLADPGRWTRRKRRVVVTLRRRAEQEAPLKLTSETVNSWRGKPMASRDGVALGTIDRIYLDNDTGEPKWALVATGTAGSTKRFVPLATARPRTEMLVVDYDATQVTGAPDIDPSFHLSPQNEQRLYRHYGTGSTPQRPPEEGTTVERG